jgi:hypothetical protein
MSRTILSSVEYLGTIYTIADSEVLLSPLCAGQEMHSVSIFTQRMMESVTNIQRRWQSDMIPISETFEEEDQKSPRCSWCCA